jgi:hypothetical protein
VIATGAAMLALVTLVAGVLRARDNGRHIAP